MNKLPPFKWFALQNFPFIENTFDALTNYELMCKIVDYVKQIAIQTNTLGTEVEALVEWFNNLDVQDEINNKLDEMAESGELADIIAQYLNLAGVLAYNTLDDLKEAENIANGSIAKTLGTDSYDDGYGNFYLIRTITNEDVVDEINIVSLNNFDTLIAEKIKNNYIENLENKIFVESIKDNVVMSPLLVLKQYINGTSGDVASYQSIAVKYNADVPEKIFILCNYNSNEYARLYIATCGSRTDGSGWSYTYTDNVPTTHGSSMCYRNGFLYIADVGNNQVAKYDIANDEFEYISLASIFENDTQYILGIAYDESSDTFLLCGNNNSNMYVVNSTFTTIIRKYTHDFNYSTNFVLQTYDFYNNLEIRCVSNAGNYNSIFFIDTFTGKLLKSVEVDSVNGEIESCSYKKGFLTVLFNLYNTALNEIQLSCVAETYVGGYNGLDYYKLLNERTLIDNYTVLNNKGFQYYPTYYLQNNNSNNDIVRYVGIGTQTNPFKSGLALSSVITSLQNIDVRINVNVLESSNTDDTSIRFQGNPNVNYLNIVGGSNNVLHGIFVQNCKSIEINAINVTEGVTRRSSNGNISLTNNENVYIRNNNTTKTGIINNTPILRASGTLAATNDLEVRFNSLLQGDSTHFTGNDLTFSNNIIFS